MANVLGATVGLVDAKGRIVIPAKVRQKLNINPKDRVEFEVKRVEHRPSFMKTCAGVLKDREEAVAILHRESPLR